MYTRCACCIPCVCVSYSVYCTYVYSKYVCALFSVWCTLCACVVYHVCVCYTMCIVRTCIVRTRMIRTCVCCIVCDVYYVCVLFTLCVCFTVCIVPMCILRTCVCVIQHSHRVIAHTITTELLFDRLYKAAKVLRMSYFVRSFSAKESYNLWLFCGKRPAT